MSQGPAVALLTEMLHLCGIYNDKSGLFDDEVLTAVKAYQQSRGLKVDGLVGANTWRTLLSDVRLRQISYVKQCKLAPEIKSTKNFLGKDAWNQWGGLIDLLADILNVEKESLLAVIQVESSGKPFDDKGRPIIRFEVHQFWKRWGTYAPDIFINHFRFCVDDNNVPLSHGQKWKGHYFKANESTPWREMHTTMTGPNGQQLEWEAFNLAVNLNSTSKIPAIESTSFGLGQIIGFNMASAGYYGTEEFFNDMHDVRMQIVAMFQFIKSHAQMLTALRNKNFTEFARHYNGPGQMSWYGGKILEAYNSAKSAKLL